MPAPQPSARNNSKATLGTMNTARARSLRRRQGSSQPCALQTAHLRRTAGQNTATAPNPKHDPDPRPTWLTQCALPWAGPSDRAEPPSCTSTRHLWAARNERTNGGARTPKGTNPEAPQVPNWACNVHNWTRDDTHDASLTSIKHGSDTARPKELIKAKAHRAWNVSSVGACFSDVQSHSANSCGDAKVSYVNL